MCNIYVIMVCWNVKYGVFTKHFPTTHAVSIPNEMAEHLHLMTELSSFGALK